MRTKAEVGDFVRVYLKVNCPYRKKGGTVFHEGTVHEISYARNNRPVNHVFRNGYVMLSGNFLLHIGGRWVKSTKRKISLDSIQRITKRIAVQS
jgi:uncharacterized protein with NRDE domain